jgi:predicted Zn-dependent protease
MRFNTLLLIVPAILFSGCNREERAESRLLIVNAASVDAGLLERVRAFAEQELQIRVDAVRNPTLAGKADFEGVVRAAQRTKKPQDEILVILAGVNGEERHLAVYPEKGMAVINAQPLYTGDEERFARRMERQVMRAAAFTLGLPPTPDPFCVTREYRSLEDLDAMGRNFSPPWQGRFADEAARRGLGPAGAVPE